MNRRSFLTTLALTPLFASDIVSDNPEDIYLSYTEYLILESLNNRLIRLRRHIGYGNFNIVSFNDALFYGRNYPKVGIFTKEELSLIDRLFFENLWQYGFYGDKTCLEINNVISKKDVQKIPHTGHYLFKGKPVEAYERLKKDIGETLVLTSGVRNVVKQLSLYVNKIYNDIGNITKASMQIAPPAYSYHTISDFDVGRKGWGYKNFTADFASTSEFREMRKLDYISMRYKKNNNYGVRFEPWHVEVI